ncbi:MAG: hypothetical protein FE048_02365 [Thermoplasmata archaeon]|nr:MAG: hypothetical protein FE048_02365 [Thermoplasmata archaeon]
MFCVECGKEVSKLYNGLCVKCYLKKEIFFSPPKKIDVFVCRNCGALKINKKWEKGMDEIIANFLKKYVKKGIECVEINFIPESKEVVFKGMLNDVLIEERKKIDVRVKNSLCEMCCRIKGGYFEAILQIRGEQQLTKKEIERIDDIVYENLEKKEKAFVTKREERHGGIDYYIGDKHFAADIAKMLKEIFHAEMNVSSSLAGKKDGKEVYRLTYGIRIPAYSKGSYVEIEGKLYKIEDIRKKIHLYDLTTGRGIHVYKKDMKKAKIVDTEEKEAVVLSIKEGEIEIMDPETFNAITILTPFKIKENVVKIIKWKGKAYVVQKKGN